MIQIGPSAIHEFAGCTVLKLDNTNNIHSIRYPSDNRQSHHTFACEPTSGDGSSPSDEPGPDTAFPNAVWTKCYYDEFASLPSILPPGPVAIFGLGAGSGARVLLHSWPHLRIEGWEIDSQVVRVARKYFGLLDLERFHTRSLKNGYLVARGRGGVRGRRSRYREENTSLRKSAYSDSLYHETPYQCTGGVTVRIGDAFAAEFGESTTGSRGAGHLVAGGGGGENTDIRTEEFGCKEIGRYAGIIVDVFSHGKPNMELRDAATWHRIVSKLLPGGRLMINCGSPGVEILDEGDVSGTMSAVGDLDKGTPDGNTEISLDSWKGRTGGGGTEETGGCEWVGVDADMAMEGEEDMGDCSKAGGGKDLKNGVMERMGGGLGRDLDEIEAAERERCLGMGDGMGWDGIGPIDIGRTDGRCESGEVRGKAASGGTEGVGKKESGGEKWGRARWQRETDAIIRAVKCVVGSEVYGKYTRDSGGNFLVLTGELSGGQREEWAGTVPQFVASGVQDWVKV